jgi:protoheme IX farnesyltransferase
LITTYLELSKLRLGSLVVFTTTAGFVLASGNVVTDWAAMDWKCCAWTSAGTALLIGAANTLNQVIERNRDSIMGRTMLRPLPLGRISVGHAIAFAVVCTVAGAGILLHHTNELTTALGVSNLCLYAFVYTPMKMLHPLNTWVGSLVGAIPPMMGAAATLGPHAGLSSLGWDAWLTGGMLFLWQIPHFLALSYFIRTDYARAGYRMLSVTNPALCARLALRYCLYMLPIGAAGWATGITDGWFAADAAALAAYLVWKGRAFGAVPGDLAARRLFRATLVYLPLVLLLAILHARPLEDRVPVWRKAGPPSLPPVPPVLPTP